MKINISAEVRQALYVVTALGTPVMVYLLDKSIIGELEMALWSAIVLAVNSLAAIKTTPDGEIQQ